MLESGGFVPYGEGEWGKWVHVTEVVGADGVNPHLLLFSCFCPWVAAASSPNPQQRGPHACGGGDSGICELTMSTTKGNNGHDNAQAAAFTIATTAAVPDGWVAVASGTAQSSVFSFSFCFSICVFAHPTVMTNNDEHELDSDQSNDDHHGDADHSSNDHDDDDQNIQRDDLGVDDAAEVQSGDGNDEERDSQGITVDKAQDSTDDDNDAMHMVNDGGKNGAYGNNSNGGSGSGDDEVDNNDSEEGGDASNGDGDSEGRADARNDEDNDDDDCEGGGDACNGDDDCDGDNGECGGDERDDESGESNDEKLALLARIAAKVRAVALLNDGILGGDPDATLNDGNVHNWDEATVCDDGVHSSSQSPRRSPKGKERAVIGASRIALVKPFFDRLQADTTRRQRRLSTRAMRLLSLLNDLEVDNVSEEEMKAMSLVRCYGETIHDLRELVLQMTDCVGHDSDSILVLALVVDGLPLYQLESDPSNSQHFIFSGSPAPITPDENDTTRDDNATTTGSAAHVDAVEHVLLASFVLEILVNITAAKQAEYKGQGRRNTDTFAGWTDRFMEASGGTSGIFYYVKGAKSRQRYRKCAERISLLWLHAAFTGVRTPYQQFTEMLPLQLTERGAARGRFEVEATGQNFQLSFDQQVDLLSSRSPDLPAFKSLVTFYSANLKDGNLAIALPAIAASNRNWDDCLKLLCPGEPTENSASGDSSFRVTQGSADISPAGGLGLKLGLRSGLG
ncbi:hypothetical protein DFJ73DRAFT_769702 [Zopfochytrium polystomum]|nr:hypothetical protein DFJ73DRAFT_769702 [Zopfochytrium polystomum]